MFSALFLQDIKAFYILSSSFIFSASSSIFLISCSLKPPDDLMTIDYFLLAILSIALTFIMPLASISNST